MLSNITRRSEHKDAGDVVKAGAKPAVNSKRRALGDITNSFADGVGDVAAKKPQFNSGPPPAEAMSEKPVDDRVYMQRMCDDVDARDVDNPLLCTTYVNEMYEHFGQAERDFQVEAAYMTKQDYVNEKMRTILVDWLVRNSPLHYANNKLTNHLSTYQSFPCSLIQVEVHLKFKMVPESLYMTVYIIDRYLQFKQVNHCEARLQLQ